MMSSRGYRQIAGNPIYKRPQEDVLLQLAPLCVTAQSLFPGLWAEPGPVKKLQFPALYYFGVVSGLNHP